VDLGRAVLLVAASTVAGAVNSIAGGGTLVSFPVAIVAGMPPLVANATNSVAMTPGALASAFGYRHELARDRGVVRALLPATLAGGVAGAGLLLATPQRVFEAVVPVLVLGAVGLLAWQNLRPRRAGDPDQAFAPWELPKRRWHALLVQLAIGVYGGYFGAGMGIMMLALLGVLGGRNIHRMNGVKSVLGAAINGLASVVFVLAGAIDALGALLMAAGAIAGGLVGASLARRADPRKVRWAVVALGVVIAGELARRRFFG
jgi:hypothetical protein